MMQGIRNLVLCVVTTGLLLAWQVTGAAQDGRILWYSFQGSGDVIEDVSGNGNDGVVEGAQRVNGRFGQGISIGKADEYVEFANILTPAATVEMWFKPNWGGDNNESYRLFDANTGAIYYLIGKGKTVGDRENTFGFYLEDAADADFQDWQAPAADLITAGQWHHVAATWDFDAGEAKLFLNGEEIGQQAGLGAFPALNPMPKLGFNVGTGYMPAANGADSIIDEFAIYSRVLQSEEIKADMANLGFLAVDPTGKLPASWAAIKQGY